MPPPSDHRVRLLSAVRRLTLLCTGLLAGALCYGAANLVPAFGAVPLELRLDFHTELMRMNGITVQGAMALSAVGSFALTLPAFGPDRLRERILAGAAGLLTVATFLITRFGNVPINARIKKWAATVPPENHTDVLRRWELFNLARTATAVAALAVLVYALTRTDRPVPRFPARPDSSGGENVRPTP
ncbi:DUF1772 domain-containing protein [Streptomyces sp. NPDC006798]|uniref:DUF1772 domain-containing protein n=1 Tax=Streptomyces sp. NPDC006798 TaxID=3155462 RepID=UPI0033CD5A7D